jgi:hypothetical protein
MAWRDFSGGGWRGWARRVVALGLGVVWWWAVLRLLLIPGDAGVVEGTVAAGGWGLSLLPVHCAPWTSAGGPGQLPGHRDPAVSGGGSEPS